MWSPIQQQRAVTVICSDLQSRMPCLYLLMCICICQVNITHVSSTDFPSKSSHARPLLMPSCLPSSSLIIPIMCLSLISLTLSHGAPLFWITHSLCCRSQTAFSIVLFRMAYLHCYRRNTMEQWGEAAFKGSVLVPLCCHCTVCLFVLPAEVNGIGSVCVLNGNAEERGGKKGERERKSSRRQLLSQEITR